MKMDYSTLHRIGNGDKAGALHLEMVSSGYDPNDLRLGTTIVEEPVAFDYHSGRYHWDQLGTTWATLRIYSDRLVNLLSQNQFSGWRPYPIIIRGKRGELLEGYSGISILGRAGSLDMSRCERTLLKPYVKSGRWTPGFRGIYFEDDRWDGSDIFTAENTGYFFCTDRVKEAISRLKPTNIRFIRLVEYEL